ncbi:MAG TPA: peptide chain release factor N(5)-glutamine methyltransferase, partial [Burkholderiaceae bacterium]|nr:peptide chain release factor N(5)-glutamine methyltransferase [Burkholderiaceae bacterium]
MATLHVALAWQQAVREAGLERLDAQVLLLHALGRSDDPQGRAWLLAHDTDPLAQEVIERYRALVARRVAGEPLAYLLGWREFHGLRLEVTPAVLVPRPDTETLVDWALACLPPPPATPRVLDLGTGSGAIALAIRHAAPHAQVSAVDSSAAALEVARRNGQRLDLPVRWHLGNWFEALPDGEPPFDLVVSNPPYVAQGDPHLAALGHEPRCALTSGPQGLDDLAHLARHAPGWLVPGGQLLLEHGHDQAPAVQALLHVAGF